MWSNWKHFLLNTICTFSSIVDMWATRYYKLSVVLCTFILKCEIRIIFNDTLSDESYLWCCKLQFYRIDPRKLLMHKQRTVQLHRVECSSLHHPSHTPKRAIQFTLDLVMVLNKTCSLTTFCHVYAISKYDNHVAFYTSKTFKIGVNRALHMGNNSKQHITYTVCI